MTGNDGGGSGSSGGAAARKGRPADGANSMDGRTDGRTASNTWKIGE